MKQLEIEDSDTLTKASMKVWLYSEVIQYVEMKKENPDDQLLEASGFCSTICFSIVSSLTGKKLNEYRAIFMMDSFTLKSVYYRYRYSQIEDLRNWAEICMQCAMAFRRFIIELSRN